MSKPKRHRKLNEAYWDYAPQSFCATTFGGSLFNPTYIHTRFKGPIANVPALKNQKIHGTNILRADSKALLMAMSSAFQKSVNFEVPRFPAKTEVFCLVLSAYRKNSYDEDNVATTIRDWLEPRNIRGKDRGWGVGVVDNDRFVNTYAIKKKKGEYDAEITDVLLVRVDLIDKARRGFIANIASTLGVDFYKQLL